MKWKKVLVVCSCLATNLALQATEEKTPLWLRYPSISPDGKQIAFTYKGDIYTVSSEGGQAQRLTTHEAYDSRPIWSPNGKQIAFVSDRYQQGLNIYIMDAQGGEARQLTTHSGTEIPYSFSPDGKYILFKANIGDDAKSTLFPNIWPELYKVSVKGGRPERVLGISAEYTSLSKDGRKLLYQDYKGTENEWRKHHTSSITRDILEYDIERKTFRYIIQRAGEDRNPIYTPDEKGIYFLSERDGGSFNVYRSNLSGGEVKALTNFKGEPVRFLSSSQTGKLCFGYGGEIYTLSQEQKPRKVVITLTTDADQQKQERMTFRSGASSVALSPDGKMIGFIARGEVFVSSAEHGTTKRITNSSEAERGITFGKDNRSLVYASRRDGRWDLYESKMTRTEDPNLANATLLKESKLLPHISGEKAYPKYSPDGNEIAFIQDRLRLVVYNFKTKELRRITPDDIMQNAVGELEFHWSPDSKWFALSYVARRHAPYTDIGIVKADGKSEIVNITNSGYSDGQPRWVLDGNALLYNTERYGMRNHASWGSMEDVMMVFLNREAEELYRMSKEERELYDEEKKKKKDEENKIKEKASKDNKKLTDKPKSESKSKDIVIELDGIEERRVRLTPASSHLADAIVSPDGKKLYYLTAFEGNNDLWSLDLQDKTNKIVNKLNTPRPYFVQDPTGKSIYIFGSTAKRLDPKNDALKNVSYSGEMKFSRYEERKAMYEEVVREQALRFYRKDMHGVDWTKLTNHYRRYLPYINNNYDFSEMLSELLGELNVSHTGSGYRVPGSSESTASLGLFFAEESHNKDGLLVDEIVQGGPFDLSTSKLRSGARILSIDGQAIKAGEDYFPLLNGKAGKKLLVSYKTAQGEIVEEIIKPIRPSKLSELLYRRWVKQRADIVDKLSEGKLGYVHIRSMGDPSFRTAYSEALGRYYDRKGIVIDIRHNGGGRLHEDIEVLFSGKQYLTQEIRGKDHCEMPSRRWNHASVMLVCENDYSNAHGTPWVYQYRKLGKVVGMPVPGTMTSVNWVTLQDPSLYFGIPIVGYRTAEGDYLENKQLEPDVVTPLDPIKALQGIDTQLEAAVKTLLAELGQGK